MNKSRSTTELTQIFPSWAKVRSSDQSTGYLFLNALAEPLEKATLQLEKMKKNQFLPTVNLDEIDQTYVVQLPATTVFNTNTSDPTNPVEIAPTVQGLVITNTSSGYLPIVTASNNDIESFWYMSIPDRVDIDMMVSGQNDVMLSQTADQFPYETTLTHHLASYQEGGGRFWIQMAGGVQYVNKDPVTQDLTRGQITLTGTTRKGTVDTETLVFAWDSKQWTKKDWRRITDIEVYNVEPGVEVSVNSADFANGPYWAFYQTRYSENGNKVDEFWDLGTSADNIHSSLDRVGYITDEWQQLVLGFSDMTPIERWDLLDANGNSIIAADLAIQPFTDRTWIVTKDKQLLCYDLTDQTIQSFQELDTATPGADTQKDIENTKILLGDDITFSTCRYRFLNDVAQYRLWYKDPNGNSYGLDAKGNPVSFTSNFWVINPPIGRSLGNEITIPSSIRGEYVLGLDVLYSDNSVQTDKVIVEVRSKEPLVQINLSTLLPTNETIEGIDFDSDQRMWIKTTVPSYYRINLHTDVMLVDFVNKVIYFKESYPDIKVTI